MKINKILLILVMGILLISCGGKTKGNETSAEGDALTESDCQCADLNLVTKDADGKDVYNFKDIKKMVQMSYSLVLVLKKTKMIRL